MRVSVFGLGYVGCVSAACLASMGHEVIGVDVNQVKVDLVNDGKAPVVEERIGELIAEVVRTGALRATADVARGDHGQRGLAGLRRHAVGAQRQPVHHVPGAGRRGDRRRAGRRGERGGTPSSSAARCCRAPA